MLHDIGNLVINKNLPEETDRIVERLKGDSTLTLCNAEMEVLGFTHPEAGALVAEKWRFPHELINAIKFHHNPEMTQNNRKLIYAVHAGNEIAKALNLGKSISDKIADINPVTWKELSLSEKDLSLLIPKIETDFDDVINFMDIN